jgi:translation elongation factor EF-Tu-like GTPase
MFSMTVQDVFYIRGRGAVATGKVESGSIRRGDEVQINGGSPVKVDALEAFRKQLDEAHEGDNIGMLFGRLSRSDINPGDVISAGVAPPSPGTTPDWPGGLPPG